MYEVIIVGGGIAGLSAALILGRCRRRVLLCDSNRPRNGGSAALHGFLSQDGINPWEIRRLGQEQLNNYPSIEFRPVEVIDACHRPKGGFIVGLASGESFSCRKLLLATGIVDHLPAIAGMEEFSGRGVFHCPYCDGWENRDLPIAVYARGKERRSICPGNSQLECRRNPLHRWGGLSWRAGGTVGRLRHRH